MAMTTSPDGRNQRTLLLEHFKTKASISGLEASALFRIRALPRRIADLEERGYTFRRERRTDTTGQRYVRYFFTGEYRQDCRTCMVRSTCPGSKRRLHLNG